MERKTDDRYLDTSRERRVAVAEADRAAAERLAAEATQAAARKQVDAISPRADCAWYGDAGSRS
jgi:hypothetical protein